MSALSRARKAAPDAVALVSPAQTLTWRELDDRVDRTAAALLRRGVRRAGSITAPVAIPGAPSLESVLALLALVRLGIPALPLHPRLSPLERTRLVGSLRLQLVLEPNELGGAEAGPSGLPAAVDPAAPVAAVATSGSTRSPRVVALSRSAFDVTSSGVWRVLGAAPGDRWLLELPLAHVGGLSVVLRSIARRVAIVLPPPGPVEPAWLESARVTLVSWVPSQLARALEAADTAPRGLRAVMLGGAGAPPALLARATEVGWPVRTTYGLTEATGTVTLESAAPAERRGSGSPLPGVAVRLSSVGEIEVSGPTLALGTYRDVVEPLQLEGGWLSTGDLGALEGDTLVVRGRASEMIITGGENVHPAEVEAALTADPAVRRACVFAIPDPLWGELVCAAIVAEGPTLDLAELDRRLAGSLASFRRPRRYALLADLPETAVGKVDRRATQELASPLLVRPALGAVPSRRKSV